MMAKLSNYTMNFSDGTLFFEVEPYSADGPESPSKETLFRTATSANTSLVILGKYFENYGERIQENLLHLLENFAMDEEPSYPVGGQIWYERNLDPNQNPPRLKVYNPKKSVNLVSGLDEIKIKGNHIVRLNNLITKQRKLRIFSNIDFQSEDYIISSPRYDNGNDETIINIPNKLLGQRRNWYVGGWDDIIISSNGTIDLKYSELQNVNVGVIETDPSNKNYNPKSVINISQLERYVKSLTLPAQSGTLTDVALSNSKENDVLVFKNGLWVNSNLSNVIENTGEITIGGNLYLKTGRIVGVKKADGTIDSEVVTVKYLNEYLNSRLGLNLSGMNPSVQIDESGTIEHLADIKDVNDARDLYSPENPEINKEGNLLYYDGNFWDGLSRSEFHNVGILSSNGTANYDDNNKVIDISTFLEPNALINYNPNSTYFNDIKDFVSKIDDNILVSKCMGDELWGNYKHANEIVYGEYDGKQISLGYEANIKPTPEDSYRPDDYYTPTNPPKGVIFDIDVLNAIHTALDPKIDYGMDDLYFESSLARIVGDYPNIKLNDIIDVINRDLGDISAYPFRQLITAPPEIKASPPGSSPSLQPQPGGFSKDESLNFDDYYTVGKSTLSIYADGLKLYASIPNTLTCEFITPLDPSDPNAKVNTLDENGNLIDQKLYEIEEVNHGSPPYVSILGDELIRFQELQELQQTISFSSNNSQFNISGVYFDPEHSKTYIYLKLDPSYVSPGDKIIVENIINTDGKIWGGYPTGLKYNLPTDASTEKHLYQFDISLDKGRNWKTVVIEGQKNVAQVVNEINYWSMYNDSNFSAFLERGKMGFISGKPGKDSSIRIVGSSTSSPVSILKIYECNGKTSPCANITDPDKIKLLEGKGFIIGDKYFSDFPVGTKFTLKGSDGNDGKYTVKEIDKNICNKNPPENKVTIRVKEEHQIKNKNPGKLGTIDLKTKNLFENMTGGVSGKRHYYYKFEDSAKWTEKFDSSDPNGDPNQDGDYSEVGMPEYQSNIIMFNKPIKAGAKLEIIINSTLNTNV
jgi:hypothetical protein